MYELTILGVLIQHPAHGYLIAKVVNNLLGPVAKVNSGRLYPLLAKMEQAGLIVPFETSTDASESGRPLNSYRITQAGRDRLRQVMLDTSSNPGDYQKIFWHKAVLLEYLKPAERLYLIDHYLAYCQSHLAHLSLKNEENNQPLEGDKVRPANLRAVADAIEHRIEHWKLELKWANNLREREANSSEATK